MLSADEVMRRFGYRCRSSFWQFVRSCGVPHVRLNSRVIRFEPAALEAWIETRRVGKAPRPR